MFLLRPWEIIVSGTVTKKVARNHDFWSNEYIKYLLKIGQTENFLIFCTLKNANIHEVYAWSCWSFETL